MIRLPEKKILQGVLILLLLIFASSVLLNAQQKGSSDLYELDVSFESYFSSEKNLPFWFTANKNGMFTNDGISNYFVGINFTKPFISDKNKNWDLSYGARFYGNYDYKSAVLPISYWVDIRYKKIIFSVGAKPDPVRFEGLSSTNANLFWSNNARPLPHFRFSTDEFISLFPKWDIEIKALYEENVLFDDRYVEDVKLHHKYFYLKYVNKKGWSIIAGLDHWVFWNGTSPTKGKLPGWKNYFDYILVRQGGEDAPMQDRLNTSGDQMGNYKVEVHKSLRNANLVFYWNHLFEDGSGMRFQNLGDGLFGFAYLNKKPNNLLKRVVLEYISTMDQSGSYHCASGSEGNNSQKSPYGKDNYFNNAIYKSGYVHYNKMMGIPFFSPNIDEEGISIGFKSSRMEAFHLGANGCINERLKWKSLVSSYWHYGTYSKPYPETIKTFSYLIQLTYKPKWENTSFRFYVAGDAGKHINNNFGLGFAVHYKIF